MLLCLRLSTGPVGIYWVAPSGKAETRGRLTPAALGRPQPIDLTSSMTFGQQGRPGTALRACVAGRGNSLEKQVWAGPLGERGVGTWPKVESAAQPSPWVNPGNSQISGVSPVKPRGQSRLFCSCRED